MKAGNKIHRILLLVLLAGALPAMLRAQEIPADSTASAPTQEEASLPLPDDKLWDKANTAYVNGDYRAAAERYAELLDRGLSSAKLYYNLGNACFKLERTGKAILCYRRALRLAPGNEDIRHNLSVAEARTRDDIEAVPEFFLSAWMRTVRRTMGCTAWTILSLAALAGALALSLFWLLSQRLSRRKTGFYGMLACTVLFIAATWFAAGERRELLDESQAVVMSSSAAVKSSPDRSSTDLFILHEGTVVRIGNRLDNWCEITIADGKKGWIDASKIEII